MAFLANKLQYADFAPHANVPVAVGMTLGCLNVITCICAMTLIFHRFRSTKVNWARIRAFLFAEVDKTVQETLERRRLGIFNDVLDGAYHLTVPPAMAGCAILSFALFYPDPPMFIAVNSVFLLSFNTGCYFVVFRATSMKGPDALLVATYLLMGAVPGFATTFWSYNLALGLAMTAHAGIAMTGINMRLFTLMNVVHLTWQLWISVAVSSSPVSLVENIAVSAVASTWNLVMCFASRAVLQKWAEAEVKALKATKGEEVVQSLLSIMCDAVVALRVDLCIRDGCPRLASLLMRPDLSRTPRNSTKFERYLVDNDAQRFREFIEHTDAEDNAARCIHVHMLDSIGTRVRVQIFHARMTDLENNVNHLLGIVEDKDQENFGEPRGQVHSLTLSEDPRSEECYPRSRSESGDESATSQSSQGTARSQTSKTAVSITNWGQVGKPKLLLRTRFSCELLAESETSKIFFNFSSLPSPTDFVSRFHEPQKLLMWLKYLHTMACCGSVRPNHLELLNISFYSPGAGSYYSGNMTAKVLDAAPKNEAFFEDDYVDLEVRLRSQKSGRKKKKIPHAVHPTALPQGPLLDVAMRQSSMQL